MHDDGDEKVVCAAAMGGAAVSAAGASGGERCHRGAAANDHSARQCVL